MIKGPTQLRLLMRGYNVTPCLVTAGGATEGGVSVRFPRILKAWRIWVRESASSRLHCLGLTEFILHF